MKRIAFLSAFAATAAAPYVASAQTNQLRIGSSFSDSFGVPFYAKDAGIFARAGFDLQVFPMSNAGAVAAALAGGALELGLGDFVSSTNAIAKGLPIQLVAGCGLYLSSAPTSFECVPKESPIRTARDLQGKSTTVPTLVGLTTAAVKEWLTKNGVDVDTVRIVELPTSTAAPTMLRGTTDSGLVAEPFYTPYKDRLRVIGLPYDAIAKEFLVSAWFASKAWIEADRERARRAVAAIYETNRWANAHQDQTLQIFADTVKQSVDSLRGMVRTQYATSLVPSQVEPVIAVAQQFNLIDKGIDASKLIVSI